MKSTGFVRPWRKTPEITGPLVATAEDIPALNVVFSRAFSDRYRKDGMVGVHVPNLNSAIWRFALEDAADGAMIWREEGGALIAFSICHLSGAEGWMGPIAIEPAYQGRGLGKKMVLAGIDYLKRNDARVIGLETMPRTMDNIGFYSSLGFVPGHLSITLTIPAEYTSSPRISQLTRIHDDRRIQILSQCGALTRELLSGYDFTREILLTDALSLGETLILEREGVVHGFALCHSVPLVAGRSLDELRVLKLVARTSADFDDLVDQLADYARRSGARSVAVRLQGEYTDIYKRMIERGAKVRWTDLRMSLSGYLEKRADNGIVLSNWEI